MYTVSALYDRIDDAYTVVRALQDAGYRRDDISLISRDADNQYSRYIGTDRPVGDTVVDTAEATAGGAAAGAGIGAVLGGLGGLLVGLGALAIPGVGPIIAAGPLAAALAGAGIGAAAGGLLGALTELGIPEDQANYYAEGVRRGGTLVVVRAEDEKADEVMSILNRYNPVNVQERASTWRTSDNWSRFDEASGPYTSTGTYAGTGAVPGMGAAPGMGAGMAERVSDVVRTGTTGVDSGMADADRGPLYTSGSMTTGMSGGDQYDSVPRDPDVIDLGEDTGPDYVGTSTSGAVGGEQFDSVHEFANLGDDWRQNEPRFQQHYSTSYGSMGHDYEYYRPAYAFGYQMARDDRYRGYDWTRFEPEARREWERTHGDTLWDDVRDAVRNAWESITR